MEPGSLELALRQRISNIEETLQSQRKILDELEADCEKAEAQGDTALYAEYETGYYQVEENIEMLEKELNECNQMMQERYF